MWFYIIIGMSFVTSRTTTRVVPEDVFSCSRGASNLEKFRCHNGTDCVGIKYVCDGIRNCPDASDEAFCLNRRVDLAQDSALHRVRRQSTSRCVLPPYPTYGTYTVSKFSNARPGESLDSYKLTLSCRRGFGFMDPNGGEGSDTLQTYCINGEYQYENLPKCVRFCKLNPDPSVRYMCHVPGVGSKTCNKYVAPGTLVNPICNSPLYYSTESMPYMKCNFGYWDYVAKCKAECGRVTPEGKQLVIDGVQVKRGELPWHVGVYRKTTTPYTQICGGSLVSNNIVLSAAHCFWNDRRKLLPSSDFAVAIGKLYRDWDSEADIGAQKSDLKEIRIPVLFQGAAANFQEDIAALILKTPFVYMTYVRPVCLYYDVIFERFQLQPGKLGKVAGWGLTAANGKASDTLQVTDMPFVNLDVCINGLPMSFIEYLTGDKFCAGNTNGKALCKGDSGGGLAFADRGLGVDRYYLRGIVSTAPTDNDNLCNDHTYTTFTKITKHQDFIKEAFAVSAEITCPLYSFQCDDGSCVDQGADCNGKQDCVDGSDEADELCKPVAKLEPAPVAALNPGLLTKPEKIHYQQQPSTTSPLSTHGPDSAKKPLKEGCVIPPPPRYGTYETNFPIDEKSFDSLILTVSCQKGYGINLKGSLGKNGTQVKCIKGEWYPNTPICRRFCKVPTVPNVRYRCQAPDTTEYTQCEEYVGSGTSVLITCPKDYKNDTERLYMKCTSGFWSNFPTCKIAFERTSVVLDPVVLSLGIPHGQNQSTTTLSPNLGSEFIANTLDNVSNFTDMPLKEGCVLPPPPRFGTYETNYPIDNKTFDSLILTVSCQKGYGINSEGSLGKNGTQVKCINGEWYPNTPICRRFCKVPSVPNVRYKCQVPDTTGFAQCEEYVSSGTSVLVTCPKDYKNDTEILYMKCTSGFWSNFPTCKTGHLKEGCVLPPPPRFGTYETNYPIDNKTFDSILTVSCEEYLSSGTSVLITCPKDYKNDTEILYMKCTSGFWSNFPTCK